MQHPAHLAAQYRIALDRAEDQTYIAKCPEIPGVKARAWSVDEAVTTLRGALASKLADGAIKAPTPLRQREGPLGAWTDDIELLNPAVPADACDVEMPVPSALRAIADWTVERYRIILEGTEDGFAAAGAELPEVLARGSTASEAATELRRLLAARAFAILSANGVPPEPLCDIEKRRIDRAERRALRRVA